MQGSADEADLSSPRGRADNPAGWHSLGRFVGFMGLTGLAMIVFAFLLLALDQRSQVQRNASRDLQATAYLLADHASRLFEVSDVALRSSTVAIADMDWAAIRRSEDLFRQFRALRQALPYVEDVWLNDSNGVLQLTSYAFPTPVSNASDREPFSALRNPTDRLYLGERIVGRVTNRPTFLLARRLEHADGSFRGMVSVTADLNYFDDYWNRVRLPFDSQVTLLRQEALDILAQHPAPVAGQAFAPAPADLLRSSLARSPESGLVGEEGGLDGDGRLGAYERAGDAPIYIYVSVSKKALRAEWAQRVTTYGLFAGAGWIAFGALTMMGFRQARRDGVATAALQTARAKLVEANALLEVTVAERTTELRASEGRLRLLVESATDSAIITMDLTGQITHWNVGARNLLGWEPAEAIGQNIQIIFTPEDRDAGAPKAALGAALTEGRANEERWLQRKDGSRFFAAGALLPMRGGEAGAPSGFLNILRDRTQEFAIEEGKRTLNETLERLVAERTSELAAANERLVAEAASRQRAEEQLRQSQKMEALGRLTGGVAHDFNNLLTVVTGNLDMLKRRLAVGPDDRARRLISQAMEGADRAAALTYRLLAFSRQQPLAPEPVDANKLVAGMSDLLRRTLTENIAIETVLAGGLWRTHVDPNQLENALLNLAVNARDAMPDGGKLTIETANSYLDDDYAATREDVRSGQYVMVAVCDTGSGMTPEVMSKAFEPFFTTKPVGKGTGLGLSQVYGFVKQSQGHASIYSEPGHGTTVKLYLPRFRQAGEPRTEVVATASARPSSAARGRGETVLVVEDEPLVRDFSVNALEEAGYRVLSAEDGPGGLALLDAHPEVALLFTDVVLTGPMNGRQVADEALKRRPDLRVLFTTGYTRNAIIHHGRLDDGVHLLGKPFTAEALAEKVGALLTDGA
ncbi:ATP-binding protein [Alsobacter sp. KACC 23698]|uniref:histidine kinase n=1 Tax=Alsobacter sp. KACC 23698 TaxID=3149229 RepID=A0AAU7JB58_9HYPH